MSTGLELLIHSFPNALWTGIIISAIGALFGVFVVLRRVVFIGVALSELAACGVAGALWLHVPPLLGAGLLTMGGAALLSMPTGENRIPRDALLGSIFVGAAGLSVFFVLRSAYGLEEVKSLLYGDLILVTIQDVYIMLALLVPAALTLVVFLRPITHVFLDREMSMVMKIAARKWELVFFLLLGLVVAVASKIVGAMLMFCYLAVPSTAALLLSRRLSRVLIIATSSAAFCTLAGLIVSASIDTPTNPTICVSSVFFLAAVAGLTFLRNLWRKKQNEH